MWTPTGLPASTPTSQTSVVYHNAGFFYGGQANVTTLGPVAVSVSGNIITVVPSPAAPPTGADACVTVARMA